MRPALGVELLEIVPATQMRVGASGLATTLGDVFVDEGRSIAALLQLELGPVPAAGSPISR